MNLFSTLTAWNETELDAMFALADDLGVRLCFQGPVGPRDSGDTAPMALQPSAAGWARLREIADQRRAEQPETASPSPGDECAPPAADATDQYHCGAGSEEIHGDPFGNVFPCLNLRWPAGNLHQQSIATQFGAPLFYPGLALTCGSDAPAASGSKTVQPIFFRAGSRRALAQSG